MSGKNGAMESEGWLDRRVCEKSFGGRYRIQHVLKSGEEKPCLLLNKIIVVCGWARTVRVQGAGSLCFIALNDGSTPKSLQVVVEKTIDQFDTLTKCSSGCSFKFTGVVVRSPAKGQSVELCLNDPKQHSFILYGGVDAAKYPLSKKQHGREFLREIAHLRPRSNFMGCVTRVRSQLAIATHTFFNSKGFLYIHTPIITTSDCEGGGEMFQVTAPFENDPALLKKKNVDDSESAKIQSKKKHFFGKEAFLTVSGQLAVENYCCSLCDVYTFGPTFRAENSHTSRHLAEFWMVEPEMAFADLYDDMKCAEEYLKYCLQWVLHRCSEDIAWLEENIEDGLRERLEDILKNDFMRVSYTEAIELLQQHNTEFHQAVEWGIDLGSEHERFLCEKIYKKPVIVFNYPKELKAFYMKQNNDGKTVAAMDVLVPKIGEVIGGSQREDRLENLDKMIYEKGLDVDSYWWYRELRKYGTVPHSGFGLGFERLVMLVTGIDNIRDVIPYPRYPGHATF